MDATLAKLYGVRLQANWLLLIALLLVAIMATALIIWRVWKERGK